MANEAAKRERKIVMSDMDMQGRVFAPGDWF